MPSIRAAQPSDADPLARLIDMAGEGIPSYFWTFSAEPHLGPFEVGRRRVERPGGHFSYRNAHVVDVDGAVVAMMLGYPQEAIQEKAAARDLPAFVQPLLDLERQTLGTWYLNALATFPPERGRGHAGLLLALSAQLAADNGLDTVTLIVNSTNNAARSLYAACGFETVDRRPVEPMPGNRQRDGDWLLLSRRLVHRRAGDDLQVAPNP